MSTSCRLQVEELDQRILPSVTTPAHALAGQGTGTYVSRSLGVDRGEGATLQGTTNLARLGHVTVTGTITGPGNVRSGHAWGTLTFANSHGRVTVDIEGPLQRGFSVLPESFSYHIVSGTGAYRSLHDQGTLTILWHARTVTHVRGSRFPITHGTFTITIAGGYRVPPPPPPKVISGIAGVAMLGPLFPSAPAGVPDSLPVPGAVIAIEPAGGGAIIARVTAAADGTFAIKLPLGRYRLVPLPPLPGEAFFPGVPQIVVVQAGHYTHVTATYRTGI